MSCLILSKAYTAPQFNEKEILRYAGCREEAEDVLSLLKECINEAKDQLTYKVCYCELPVKINGNICDFEAFGAQSESLASRLKSCERVILFAATVGVGLDRLVAKYSRISPAKAVMLQAIGAERIEALCDAFCEDMAKDYSTSLKTRFSPGYGDLPLEVQTEIFKVLDCERKIGLTLNDSLLMSPTKSVTAIVGIDDFKPVFRGV